MSDFETTPVYTRRERILRWFKRPEIQQWAILTAFVTSLACIGVIALMDIQIVKLHNQVATQDKILGAVLQGQLPLVQLDDKGTHEPAFKYIIDQYNEIKSKLEASPAPAKFELK